MKKLLSVLILSSLVYLSLAQVVTPFTVRRTITQKGGILYLSNTASKAIPTNIVQNEMPPSGTGYDNNFTNGYVDIDNDVTTWMSSSDQLNLPTCSEISWAGLYWGADCSTGDENFATRNQVKMKVNSGPYINLMADYLKDNTVGYRTYHCFKDVTSILQSNGLTDVYTVANVATDIGGTNLFGGWTLVVVFKNNLLTMRNLTVFDGLANVSAGSSPTVDIPISGFQTPLSGPVNFELGLVVYDGDRSLTGDQLLFKGGTTFLNISDAIHPSTDMFNSTIARNGTLTASRNPNYNNTLGYDANIFSPNNSTKNYIGNNAISATIRQTTGGETFLTQVVTSAIDVYEPDLRSAVRVRNLNHPYAATATPGDTLEYVVNGLNIGSDPSINTFITDTIEGNAQYVPGSIRITSGPNTGIKTDAASDDQAEYISASKTVRVRIGTNANNFIGGLVLNSPTGTDSTQFKFKVTVSTDCVYLACDSIIDNSAFITGTGNVSGNIFNNASNPGVFNTYGCPISGTTKSPIGTGGCSAPGATINTPVCLGGNINLSTSLSPSATYLWTGPNSFTSTLRQPTITGVSAVNGGTYIANVFIIGTGCHFVFPLNANLTIANAGADQTSTLTCGLTTLTLSANNPLGSTGTWSIVAGTGGSFGSGNTATTNVASSTFNGIAGNVYTLRWSLSSGSCPTTTDDLAIIFQNAASTAVLSGTTIPCASELAVTLTGGASPFTINVSNGVGQISSYISNTHFTVNPNSSTNYSLISVTGSNGCVAVAISGAASITVSSNMGTGTIIPTNPPSGTVATTAESYPSIATGATGTYTWTNPANALTNNSVYSSVNFTGNSNLQSQYLYLTGFFTSTTIPSSAVIDGIKVKLRKHATGTITDNRVQLYNGGGKGTAKTLSGNWSTTDQDYFYGNSTDLWNATLTPTIVSNSNFGLRIRVSGNTNTTAYIDYATMIVYYHIGNNTYCDYVNNAGFAVSGYSNAASYIWTPPTGASIISGQGTSSVVVDFNGAGQSGNYAILVTPSSGCVIGAPASYNIPISDCVNSSLSIIGNVYWDINGSTAPQKVDGTGIATAKGAPLYVTLVNTSNSQFVATTSVSANGTYVFNPVTLNNNYQITLSTVNYTTGTNPSTVLPVGVSYNGEINNVISNTVTGNDGTTNGKLTVASFNTNNETNVNFGLKILTPPLASNDAASANEDTPLTLSVTTNDNDIDGIIAVNTITLASTTNNGTWTANSSGVVSYTPALNFNGLASVSYSVKDNDAQVSNAATISVNVFPVNDPPRGLASSVTTNENVSYTFSAANFNYSDVESNTMTAISLASLPATGTLYYNGITASNSLTIPSSSISLLSFAPLFNQFASPYTSFTFRVNDTDPGTITGTMTINVLHVNVAPQAVNDLVSATQNTVVSFNVLTNDVNVDGTLVTSSVDLDPLSPLQQTSLIMPGQGTFAVNNVGLVTFTPAAAFFGNTSPILYTVANSLSLTSNNATIMVIVIPYGAPTAVNDATVTNENTQVTFNVTNNDYDDVSINVSRVDFDAVTPGYQQAFYVSGKGQFYADNLGNVTFSPDWNFFGVATCSYTVKDNLNLTSNLAQITVTVNWVNQPPFATDDFITTNEDTPVTFSAVTNDYDVDGTIDLTSIDLNLGISGPQTSYTIAGQGVFSADNFGNISFTPALNFNGNVSPKGYVVKDNLGAISDSAIVNIVVSPVNDAPQANNDVAYTSAVTTTGSVTFNVVANDLDIDGIIDSTTVDLDPNTSGIQNSFSVPGEGNYTVDNVGNITFLYTFATPDGTCTPIRYVVPDNSAALSNTASITVYILPLGTPIAVSDTIYLNEDTSINYNITSNDIDDNGVDPSSISLLGPLATSSGTWAVTDAVNFPGSISFTPSANFNGTVSITYTVNDYDPLTSNIATIRLTVLPINDAPSFSLGANQSVCENSGVQILNNWVSNISTGPANEAAQSLTFTVVNNNNLLFSGQPTVDASGNLSFSSASNMNGVATVSIILEDDGGTLSSGINTSSVQLFTITVNATPSISSVTSSVRCDAGTVSIGATASNGILNWYDVPLGGTSLGIGTVFNPSVTSTFVYYVNATFAGCTSTRSALTATVNSSPTISLSTSSATLCSGATATLIVNGASTYTWYPGAISGTSISVNPTSTSIYSVTGTDAVGCSGTKSISLIIYANPTLTALSSATAICVSTSATFSVSGASTYTWIPGALSGSNITVSPPGSIIYTVTGQNALGCLSSKTLALLVNSNPTLTALSSATALCLGNSANLSASGATTFTWMPGLLSGSLVTVFPLVNTVYTLSGTNALGCRNTTIVSLQVNAKPILTAVSNSTAICQNATATLTATGAQTYNWNPGALSGSVVSVSPLATVIYTLSGTNSSGCTETMTLSLVVNSNPTLTAISSSSAICANASATLTGNGAQTYDWNSGAFSGSVITVSPLSTTVYTLQGTNSVGCSQSTTLSLQVNTNPILLTIATTSAICVNGSASFSVSGANSYTWMPSASTTSVLTVTPLTTTNYSVSGTNLNGCISIATLNILVNSNPSLITSVVNSSICAGSNSTLSASGALNYTWMPGNLNLSSIVVSPTASITYTVIGVNASACSTSSIIAITVNANPTVVTNATSSTLCAGASISLTATGANTYVWNPAALSGTLITVSPTATIIYSVTGTNAFNCSHTKTISITVNSNPTLTAISSSTSICAGQSATLSAGGATSYTVNPGALSGSLVSVSPAVSTSYTISGQNASGCITNTTMALVVNANPTLVVNATSTLICSGASLTLSANGAQSYTWNPGALSGSTVTLSPASSLIYTISGTNASGCVTSTNVAVTVNALPVVTITIPSATICANSAANLFASGAASYTWNPGNLSGASISPSLSANTVYTLQATSNQGCEVTSTIALFINNCPTTANDSLTTIENTPVLGDASPNDTNTGGGLFAAGSPSGGGGTFYMDPATGQYTYTPASGFTGTSTVSYTLCNGSPVVCSTAQITFTVFPTLIAVPDLIVTNPGITTSGSLTLNDFGVVSGAVYSVSITQPSAGAGTLLVNPATGQYTFIPTLGFMGITSATYTICNLSVNTIVCSTATIVIIVANLPMAVNDNTTTMQSMPVSGNASINDTGAESTLNPSYTASLLTAAAGVFVMDASTGNYTFTPASGFTGTATAAYTLCNVNSPPCSSASVAILVYPTLLAMPDVIYGNPNTSVDGTLTSNDNGIVAGANYAISLSALAANEGTMVVNPATGEYTFTPSATFSGSTATTYTICNVSVTPPYCSNASIQFYIGKAQMAVTKNVLGTKKVNARTYQTVFEFKLSNIGNAIANNVQLVDNLTNAFPNPITYTVNGITAALPLEINANYNGSSVVALLTGSNSLAPLQSAALTLTVHYNPNSNSFSQLSNMALATSALLPDPSGNAVHNSSDTSNTGDNVDPNGNGNPNDVGENNPALFGQQIALSKSALPSIAIAKGISQTSFIFTLENIGVVKATNIELLDNLNQSFPTPVTYTVVEKTTGTLLTLNANYNGNTVINLLAGNNSLLPGSKESITLTVNYSMNGSNYTSLFNTATANSKDELGHTLSSDVSQSGTNCDPNDNGDPNEVGENEATYFLPALDSAEVEFSIPQGFSPNNDGVNDLFVIRGISTYPDNELTIFNRWGNIVYRKKAYDNTWNGKVSEGFHFGSDDLPEGTYFYVLDIGTGKPHKGYVYLNRAVK